MKYKKQWLSILLLILLMFGCNPDTTNGNDQNENELLIINSIDEIDSVVASMTLEEKAGQIIQRLFGTLNMGQLVEFNIGSVLSGGGGAPTSNTPEAWVEKYNNLQLKAAESSTGIPIIYGIDAVHGHNNVENAVMFPHNIGLGAADNPELMEQIGAATAQEMITTGLDWNFAPAVSVVQDIRWGRSYESFGEETALVTRLAIPYIEGLQAEGIIATAKHFIGDGQTNEGDDQGDVIVTKEELLALNKPAFDAAIDAGVKTIMASFNSFQGEKMHGSSEFLTDLLRTEMGFDGLVVSDWEAIEQLPGDNTVDKVALAINAGVDLLMQPTTWEIVYNSIITAVETGLISEERLNEAVKRNLVLKFEAGLLDGDVVKTAGEIGSDEIRFVARQAVGESMVLLKNDSDILPLSKESKIYLTGPASDNLGYQCGGWTLEWQGVSYADIAGGTSVKDALEDVLSETGGTLVEDISEADVVIMVLGEEPYTEGAGDTDDLSIIGGHTLEGNLSAIEEVQNSGKPVVTLLLAGRPLIVDSYIDQWDAFVMGWLPGTEALGVTDVLFGDRDFTGKLPVTWPKDNSQSSHTVNMDDYDSIDHQYKFGFGL